MKGRGRERVQVQNKRKIWGSVVVVLFFNILHVLQLNKANVMCKMCTDSETFPDFPLAFSFPRVYSVSNELW